MTATHPRGAPLIGLRYGMPGPAKLSREALNILNGVFEDADGYRASFADRKKATLASGDYMLRLAVFEDAASLLARGSTADMEYLKAREWVESDDTDWPFSFVPLCEAMGWDVGRLREALLAVADGPRAAKRLVRGAEFRGMRQPVAYGHINKRLGKRALAELKKRKQRQRRA